MTKRKMNWIEAENLISEYQSKGGTCVRLNEGVLLDGDWVLTSNGAPLREFVLLETYLNPWSSDYTLIGYPHGKLPLKYQNMAHEAEVMQSELDELDNESEDWYTPSATYGDYSPSCPWNAPGMSIRDFI